MTFGGIQYRQCTWVCYDPWWINYWWSKHLLLMV